MKGIPFQIEIERSGDKRQHAPDETILPFRYFINARCATGHLASMYVCKVSSDRMQYEISASCLHCATRSTNRSSSAAVNWHEWVRNIIDSSQLIRKHIKWRESSEKKKYHSIMTCALWIRRGQKKYPVRFISQYSTYEYAWAHEIIVTISKCVVRNGSLNVKQPSCPGQPFEMNDVRSPAIIQLILFYYYCQMSVSTLSPTECHNRTPLLHRRPALHRCETSRWP